MLDKVIRFKIMLLINLSPVGLMILKSASGFAMAGVPSRNKMYRTSAFSDVHAAVHFAQKTRVYTVHFANDIYTLLSDF